MALTQMEQEQLRRQREGDVFAAARQRRLDSQRMTAIADPGRYAPSVRQEALDWQRTGGLRAHELAVADKGIAQERVKAWGLANQGGVAAGIKAGVERDANRSQHGYFDENGNYVPGSTVRAAEATGLWKSELNENNWRNRKAIKEMDEEGKNNRKQKDLDFKEKELNNNNEQKGYDRDAKKGAAEERADRIKERQAQKDALREQKDFEKFLTDVENVNINMTAEERKAFNAMSPDDQKAFWKKKVGREDQRQNDAPSAGGKPKEGDRRQTANGMAVFRNGKWVLETK